MAGADDLPLGRVGQHHPATRAKLDEIEARAFERSGRLDEMRREAGLPVAKTDKATKEKIISRLVKKPATTKASAKSTASGLSVTR